MYMNALRGKTRARRAVRLMNDDLKADGIRQKDLHYYIEKETIVDPI
ncbi:MAG: hypothetical protein ISN29_01475 [Gammaproteobacteria bacterium AqS3]|nr:hypothetical protein [Gammaproteobacteria bacterium AqS3]